MRVESEAGEGELRHVRLAHDHRAGPAQAGDDRGVDTGRGRIAHHDGAGAGGLPRHVEQILDRHDRAVEGAEREPGPAARVRRLGRRARLLRVEAGEDGRVAGCDPGQAVLEGLAYAHGLPSRHAARLMQAGDPPPPRALVTGGGSLFDSGQTRRTDCGMAMILPALLKRFA